MSGDFKLDANAEPIVDLHQTEVISGSSDVVNGRVTERLIDNLEFGFNDGGSRATEDSHSEGTENDAVPRRAHSLTESLPSSARRQSDLNELDQLFGNSDLLDALLN